MTEKIYYTYKLIDPRNSIPFYVGKGKNNRAISHISRAKKWKHKNKHSKNVNRKLYNKILSILNDNEEIIVEYVMKNLFEKDAFILEKKIIKEI